MMAQYFQMKIGIRKRVTKMLCRALVAAAREEVVAID